MNGSAVPDTRLDFERLTADLSARLVALPPEQVDNEIQNSLEKCLHFFGIDRIALLRLLPCKTKFIIVNNADVAGISPYPTGAVLPVSLAPWTAKKLIDGEVVSFARREELPPEADADKRALEMFQTRSGMYVPIAALRSSEYSLGINSSDYNRNCAEENVPRLRLLGEILVNAIERSRAEQALYESEERLSLAASAAEAGLWIMDVDKGLMWETQKFRELFQFAPDEELSFDRFLDATHPDDRKHVRTRIRESIGKRQALNIEYRIVRPDGAVRWISTIGNPSSPTSKDSTRLMGVSIDVTERKVMELQLRERLEEIQRLKRRLENENVYLREEIKTGQGFQKIVGKSEAMQYLFFRIQQVAPTDATVLILGETGTGKGLVAHAIHEMSGRKDRPMITVNCASLPANLVESELFGREKGAFTGASARQVGRFEIADGGTIFLDEVGEIPLELQAKLLRVLQDGEFERLGSPRTITVNVRVIAATSRDLKAEIRKGRFREDLFYRLHVFPVSIPSLSMRPEDIPELVGHFAAIYARKIGRQIRSVSKSMIKSLQEYHWPGNVRELEHVIERAVITSTGPDLRLADRLEYETPEVRGEPLKQLAAVEREHMLRVLQKTGWKIDGESGAAALLGLHPSTLRFRLKKLGIKRP